MLPQLSASLDEFYAPSTPPSVRAQINAQLVAAQHDPAIIPHIQPVLLNPGASPALKFFAASTLHHHLQKIDQSYLVAILTAPQPLNVLKKAAQVYADFLSFFYSNSSYDEVEALILRFPPINLLLLHAIFILLSLPRRA